jgi:SAM-dependent methyltransferase
MLAIPEIMPETWTELVTLDIDEACEPDVVHDLEDLPLPFDDNMFDEIHAYEVLEHTGRQGDWRFFFNQFYEFWRILKPGGKFVALCPMWDGVWCWGDPGHTRCINRGVITYLVQEEYEKLIGKTSMTDYRHWWKGNFHPLAMQEEGETFAFVLEAVKDEELGTD